jgi:hypothetical protein
MFRHMVAILRGSWVLDKLRKQWSALWACADYDPSRVASWPVCWCFHKRYYKMVGSTINIKTCRDCLFARLIEWKDWNICVCVCACVCHSIFISLSGKRKTKPHPYKTDHVKTTKELLNCSIKRNKVVWYFRSGGDMANSAAETKQWVSVQRQAHRGYFYNNNSILFPLKWKLPRLVCTRDLCTGSLV